MLAMHAAGIERNAAPHERKLNDPGALSPPATLPLAGGTAVNEVRGAALHGPAATRAAPRSPANPAEARLETLVRSLGDAVLVVDETGAPVLSNEAFGTLVQAGPTSPDERGRPVDMGSLQARVGAGEAFSLPLATAVPGTGPRHYEGRARPVRRNDGSRAGGVLVVRDTTDLRERHLQEEFVGIVAHELRTPLTALRGSLLILEGRSADAGDEPLLELALEQAARLERLLDDLADLTRIEFGHLSVEPETVALPPLVRQAVQVATTISRRHRFWLSDQPADLLVRADPVRIQQVLLNLLVNAIVHAPNADEVAVRVRRLPGRAEVEIEDRGPGIPAELQPVLFSRFRQGRDAHGRAGLGLGLFIARELVVAHGGTLEVDSEPGRGATFRMRLPLAPEPNAGPQGA